MSSTGQQAPGIRRNDLQRRDLSVPGARSHPDHVDGQTPTTLEKRGKPFLVVVE